MGTWITRHPKRHKDIRQWFFVDRKTYIHFRPHFEFSKNQSTTWSITVHGRVGFQYMDVLSYFQVYFSFLFKFWLWPFPTYLTSREFYSSSKLLLGTVLSHYFFACLFLCSAICDRIFDSLIDHL